MRTYAIRWIHDLVVVLPPLLLLQLLGSRPSDIVVLVYNLMIVYDLRARVRELAY